MLYNGITGDLEIFNKEGYETPIKDIVDKFQKGEDFTIWTYNEEIKQLEQKRLLYAIKIEKKMHEELVQIKFNRDDLDPIRCNPNYLIWEIMNEEWVKAKDLKVFNRLMGIESRGGTPGELTYHPHYGTGGQIRSISIVESEDLYALTVEGNYNFFANGRLIQDDSLVNRFKS